MDDIDEIIAQARSNRETEFAKMDAELQDLLEKLREVNA